MIGGKISSQSTRSKLFYVGSQILHWKITTQQFLWFVNLRTIAACPISRKILMKLNIPGEEDLKQVR